LAPATASKKLRRKRRKVNKIAAIRAYLAGNPGKSPKDVAAELKKDGIVVSAQFVSTVKSTSGKKAGKRGRKPGKSDDQRGNGLVSLADLVAAKQLVNKLGGLDSAVAAINVLAKLK